MPAPFGDKIIFYQLKVHSKFYKMKALVLIFLSLAQFRESHSTGAPGTTTTRPLRFELEYTLIVANSPDCPSFQAYPPPELQYREGPETQWTTLTSKILLLFKYNN